MGSADLLWINAVKPVIFAYLIGNIIVQALEGVGHIGIFFNLPIQSVKIVIDELNIGLFDKFTHFGMLVAIEDICLGGFFIGRGQQDLFNQVLNLFHRWQIGG